MQNSVAIPNAILGNHGCLFTNVFEESDHHTYKRWVKILLGLPRLQQLFKCFFLHCVINMPG